MRNQLTKTDFETDIAVPIEDSADDVNVVDVVGKKSDTTAGDSLVSLVKVADAAVDGIQTDSTALLADVGDASAATLGSIYGILGDPATTITADISTVDGKADTISTAVVTTIPGTITTLNTAVVTDIPASITTLNTAVVTDIPATITAIDTIVDNIEDYVDGTTATPNAYRREYGRTQIKEVSITANADAGVTTVATITTQPCMIKSVTIHADAAQTADMTTCAVEGGTNQVVEFIGTTDAIQANLDAADKQVGWTGAVRFAASEVITIDLQGTGATATDLTISIEYMSCVDGGYLA